MVPRPGNIFPVRDSLWLKATLLPDGLWYSAMSYDVDLWLEARFLLDGLWHSAMPYGDVGLWDIPCPSCPVIPEGSILCPYGLKTGPNYLQAFSL